MIGGCRARGVFEIVRSQLRVPALPASSDGMETPGEHHDRQTRLRSDFSSDVARGFGPRSLSAEGYEPPQWDVADYRNASNSTVTDFASHHGRVAELADAQDSGSCVRKNVGVQVPPRPRHSKVVYPCLWSEVHVHLGQRPKW